MLKPRQTQAFFFALFLPLCLVGCHHAAPPMPAPILSPEQRQCLERCQHLNHYCMHQRKKIYLQCRELTHQQATLNYRAYYDAQLARKKRPSQMKKSFKDFYNPEHCEDQLDCRGEEKLCRHGCDV